MNKKRISIIISLFLLLFPFASINAEYKITLDDLAEKCDTINYEILCTIGARVPRVFIDNNK